MKKSFNLAERQQQVKEAEGWVGRLKCCTCDKEIEGYYSRHGAKGTCSRKCMKVEDEKPRFPGHSDEDFCKNFNL